jgi:hypothetical protein
VLQQRGILSYSEADFGRPAAKLSSKTVSPYQSLGAKQGGDMPNYRKDLDEDLVKALDAELHAQTKQTFDKVVETDWRFTQHNFLINAGGAVAVLAYIGSSSDSKFAIWSLLLFVVGVIASGVEIRALLREYGSLHKDALRRLSGFMHNTLSIDEITPKDGIAPLATKVNHWSGVVAQGSFVLGVGVGLVLYFCNVP